MTVAELLEAMVSKEDTARLEIAVARMHHCRAVHLGFRPVRVVSNGETVWEGDVEILRLFRHPQAQWCYAWPAPGARQHAGGRFVAVLAIPPVDSPEAAIRAQLARDGNSGDAK